MPRPSSSTLPRLYDTPIGQCLAAIRAKVQAERAQAKIEKPLSPKYWTTAQMRDARRRRAAGESWDEIAKALGRPTGVSVRLQLYRDARGKS